jgi:hypothetical protein
MSEPWPPGTRVQKTHSRPDDGHQDGALGRVCVHPELGTHAVGPIPDGGWGYFVEWDDLPGIPVIIAGHRILVVRVH